MPLPDERPRQSVANLIGRFEEQNKRQSFTSPSASRPSSAVSFVVGDAAKEEIKEKREWPPKSRPVPSTVPVEPQNEEMERKSQLPISPPEPAALLVREAAPFSSEDVIAAEPVPPPSVETAVPVPKTVPQRQSSIGAAPPARTPVTPSKSTPARSAAATRAPVRTPARSPPSSFQNTLSASTSTPITRSSSNTPAAAAKPRPSSTTPHRPPAPTTPARPKTPSVSRPKTPSASRPKTPSSVARPKTPASGLFAPTAASLAKARNASSPVPPTPTRKPTVGLATLERLSKPTASSISKVRTPTLPPPAAHARGGKVSGRGAAPTRGMAAKTRGGAAAKAPAKKAAALATVTASAADERAVESEVKEHPEEVPEHQHEESTSTLVDEPEHTAEFTEEPEVHHADGSDKEAIVQEVHAMGVEEANDRPEVTAPVDDYLDELSHTSESGPLEHITTESVTDEAVHETLSDTPHHDSDHDSVHVEVTSEVADLNEDEHVEGEVHDHNHEKGDIFFADDAHVNGKTGTDVEDIVNLLETKPRPASIAIIPDEVAEIPDEY